MPLHPLVFQSIPLCKEGVAGWDILEVLLKSSAGRMVRPRGVKEANSTFILIQTQITPALEIQGSSISQSQNTQLRLERVGG